MKATLKLDDGREIAVELTEEQVKELEKTKKTGYERVENLGTYHWVDILGNVVESIDFQDNRDCKMYDNCNYHSDKTVAEHNARADTLKRRLRRFAVEHRVHELDWGDTTQRKVFIEYNYDCASLEIDCDYNYCGFGKIYFDSEKTAQAAIKEFKDELIWYFTEYKDSL